MTSAEPFNFNLSTTPIMCLVGR